MSDDRLTHLDERGRAHMVNIGEKAMTHRVCVARGEVRMAPATLARIAGGEMPKGDVLAKLAKAGSSRCGLLRRLTSVFLGGLGGLGGSKKAFS